MKICRNLIYLITLTAGLAVIASAQTETAIPQLIRLSLDPQKVTTVHLRPGYVSSVRVPEPVSSVVVGDPTTFKAEHSEAEPLLVFFKPASPHATRSNALITTRTGHQISLTLLNDAAEANIDYLLRYDPPQSFLIQPLHPSFLIENTRAIEPDVSLASARTPEQDPEDTLLMEQIRSVPHWEGKGLRVSIGPSFQTGDEVTLAFSVMNSSDEITELLSPQVQLAGNGQDRHKKWLKAEPVPVKSYRLSSRKLGPGERADGWVVFERPQFKASRERLLLQIAQSDQVDRPVLTSIPFIPRLKELRNDSGKWHGAFSDSYCGSRPTTNP